MWCQGSNTAPPPPQAGVTFRASLGFRVARIPPDWHQEAREQLWKARIHIECFQSKGNGDDRFGKKKLGSFGLFLFFEHCKILQACQRAGFVDFCGSFG